MASLLHQSLIQITKGKNQYYDFPFIVPCNLFLDDMELDDVELGLDDKLVPDDKELEHKVVGDPLKRIQQ